MSVDVVVIGGGVAGLYAAYKLGTRHDRVVLLERNATLGGRAQTHMFADVPVSTGAGVGRKGKDVRLQALLRDLGVSAREFKVTHSAQFACRAQEIFDRVQAAFERSVVRPRVSFRDFAIRVVGETEYEHLVTGSGFSDYGDADVADVLYRYGFEDNVQPWTALGITWGTVISALERKVARRCVILRSCTATHMRRATSADEYVITTTQGTLRTRAIVIATDIRGIRSLLPHVPAYAHIHGQPFTRIYAAVSGRSAEALRNAVKGITVVRGPLQKLIAITDKVYMIAYSDNASALIMKDAAAHKSVLERMVEKSLGLPKGFLHFDDTRCYFYEAGTHYNDAELQSGAYSLSTVQHPLPNVLVVGEAVSDHQGWVEGALESVDAVLP
jgi:hypothetical protein